MIALGPEVADVLLVELSFGKRGTRDAILPIIRELRVEDETVLRGARRVAEGGAREVALAEGARNAPGVGLP